MSELDDVALPLISAARNAAGVAAVLVLYRFCSSAIIRQLRAQDCMVLRVPADMGELVMLCRAAMAGRNPTQRQAGLEAPRPRRFDDNTLAAFSAAANNVACGASRNPADAELHKGLQNAAGLALNILEDAMDRLARAEGLLDPGRRF